MAIFENISTKIGDQLLIEASFPIMGLTSINGYEDSITDETNAKYFKKEFKYSLNGVIYSDWLELNDLNLQKIEVNKKKPFYIDYRYTRVGIDSEGEIKFNWVKINGEYGKLTVGPSFKNSIFNEFLNPYNHTVLDWSRNVLEKTYIKSGNVVPKYIDRDGDFIDFWRTITTYFAFIVIYARSFRNFDYEDKLIRDYLDQKDIFNRKDENYLRLSIILNSYYNEIRKRGTIKIIDKEVNENKVEGELLRLIEKKDTDEFIFQLVPQNQIGWWVDKSSPMYEGIIPQKYISKNWGNSESIDNLDDYPIIGAVNIENEEGINTLHLDGSEANTLNGLGVNYKNLNLEDIDFSKGITVSPYLDYKITFKAKAETLSKNLTFGIIAFNKVNEIQSTFSIINGENVKVFFEREGFNKSNFEYQVEGYLFNVDKNLRPTEGGVTSFGFGQHLKFGSNTICKILPIILIDTEVSFTGNCSTNIWDINITPLSMGYSTGFIQSQNLIRVWIKNNSKYSDQQLKNNIRKKLIPYNSFLGINIK